MVSVITSGTVARHTRDVSLVIPYYDSAYIVCRTWREGLVPYNFKIPCNLHGTKLLFRVLISHLLSLGGRAVLFYESQDSPPPKLPYFTWILILFSQSVISMGAWYLPHIKRLWQAERRGRCNNVSIDYSRRGWLFETRASTWSQALGPAFTISISASGEIQERGRGGGKKSLDVSEKMRQDKTTSAV